MGRALARTPVPNAVYSTARASACFGCVLVFSERFGGCRFLSSEEVALQRRSPCGDKVFCSAYRNSLGREGLSSRGGFPRLQIIDLTRFQVSYDFFSYRKTFFVFSARKDFFENISSHYSWKFNGHVEHMKMTAIVRTMRCASGIGLPTPPSLPLGPCKSNKAQN